jgi:D-hydroxyproline dehydrogenase subunit gamma
MTRSASLRVAGVARGAPVRLLFDGIDVAAHDGETLATALYAAGIRTLRHAPGDGGPRGLFCAMGSCQECVVLIDGQRVEACRVPVRDGMAVLSIR